MTETNTLKEKWMALKNGETPMRIRNAAAELGVSEVELLATEIEDKTVVRLKPELENILKEIESLGKVMALSRNNEVVHERKGVYANPSFGPHASMFVNPDIDLRLFLNHWKTVFAVQEPSGNTVRRSLQFFDAEGTAMHKIYLTVDSNVPAFEALVEKFKADDQTSAETVLPKTEAKYGERNDAADVAGFQAAWLGMKDTHAFFMMTRKFNVSRLQALEIAPEGHATKVENAAVRKACELAVESQTPIMVFVGNKGIVQIHSGAIKNLMDRGPWFNILDPDFNMHLNEEGVSQVYVVRKPTEDGIVTSIEVFNEKEELVVTFFGARKPGIPELEGWRAIVAQVEKELTV